MVEGRGSGGWRVEGRRLVRAAPLPRSSIRASGVTVRWLPASGLPTSFFRCITNNGKKRELDGPHDPSSFSPDHRPQARSSVEATSRGPRQGKPTTSPPVSLPPCLLVYFLRRQPIRRSQRQAGSRREGGQRDASGQRRLDRCSGQAAQVDGRRHRADGHRCRHDHHAGPVAGGGIRVIAAEADVGRVHAGRIAGQSNVTSTLDVAPAAVAKLASGSGGATSRRRSTHSRRWRCRPPTCRAAGCPRSGQSSAG